MKAVRLRDERGVMIVMFAIVLPLILIVGAVTWDAGNWWTHRKHLQTKADAGALAGGGSWEFPCGSSIDGRIVAEARKYVGPHRGPGNQDFTVGTTYNPQIGGKEGKDIHVVLNGNTWWDDDDGLDPADSSEPVGSICESMTLDVKATEANNDLLFGLVPFVADIKRRARVEVQEVESVSGLLPIAVRAPEPVSAAIFYNEGDGSIRGVKYFVRNSSIFGLPASLQGWSTYNSEDPDPWARFTPNAKTGVAIAVSLRGACDTNLPSPNTKIVTSSAPCFEDEGFTDIDQLCNQGSGTQVVECFYATGNFPSESVQSGLHFIRGYPEGNVGSGRPELRGAWLENVDCPANGYFNSVSGLNPCRTKLTVKVDVGSLMGNPPGLPNSDEETRNGLNTQVRYCLVRSTSNNQECQNQFDPPQDMNCAGAGPEVTCSTVPGTHLSLPHNSLGNGIAIEVKLRHTTVAGRPACTLDADYSDNCRWFYTGNGFYTVDTEPTRDLVLAAPVQRSFRGNSTNSSSVRWLRLTADRFCDGSKVDVDWEAASQPIGGTRCFFMDMGLKGGLALDADEPAIVFDDGSGKSQTGAVDCDPDISQGQMLIQGIVTGCGPSYARHPFDWNPACPQQNNLFTTPNPGPPWNDGRWPPLRCIKTRPSSTANQFDRGFDRRFFGSEGAACPSDATGFVRGRNYWDQDNNPLNNRLYGYKDDSPARDTHFHPDDPRVITIFLTTTEGFTNTGQDTFPISGFVEVYVTGYGRLNGSGNLTIDDPCPGSTPPPAADYECSGSDCGNIVWGHFINYRVPSARATPSGRRCNPGASTMPCVATLVE